MSGGKPTPPPVQEFERCVAVQLQPGDDQEVAFNTKLSEDPLLPSMDDTMKSMMSMTTLIGGHANYMNRCFWYGVKCNHKDHCGEAGCMCMAFLGGRDPAWASAVQEGTKTTVLRWQIREDKEAMSTIILADNVKHGANLVEHNIQMVKRLAQWCKAEETVLGTVNKNNLVRKLIHSSPTTSNDDALFLLMLAMRLWSSPLLGDLEEFKNQYLKSGKVDAEPKFYGALAKLPLDLDLFRGAALKCQLTGPEDKMTKSVIKFLACSDVERICDQSKDAYAQARRAEHCMNQFREELKDVLPRMERSHRVDALTRVDCQIARIVFKRACKFKTMEGECFLSGEQRWRV